MWSGATGPRGSERKVFLREGLREDLRKPPRGTLVMKTKSQGEGNLSQVFRGPLEDPRGERLSSRLENGWNRQGVRLQDLPQQPTLETCSELPFTRTIANELLHSKHQKECNSFSTTARMNYCTNYCNIKGGWKNFKFSGALKFAPFYRDSLENRHFGTQKSNVSRGNFRCEVRPPLALSTFWPPPLSDSRFPTFSEHPIGPVAPHHVAP